MSLISTLATPLNYSLAHSMASELGDAVRSDGTLKDASEMIWSYDADESIPFPSGDTSGSRSVPSDRHAQAVLVAGVRRTTCISRPSRRFLEEAEPAPSAPASTKRKAPLDRPDRRVVQKIPVNVDEDEDTFASAKCKAPHYRLDCQVVQKIPVDVDEDEDMFEDIAANGNADVDAEADTDGGEVANDSDALGDASNCGTTTELTTEPGSDDYEALKAMADVDNRVHSPLPSH